MYCMGVEALGSAPITEVGGSKNQTEKVFPNGHQPKDGFNLVPKLLCALHRNRIVDHNFSNAKKLWDACIKIKTFA